MNSYFQFDNEINIKHIKGFYGDDIGVDVGIDGERVSQRRC